MKVIISESKLHNIVIKFLNSEYGGLKLYDYNNFLILLIKDGEIIFDYNKKSNVAYISYKHIGHYLEGLFGMGNRQIREVIKLWLEEYYNLPVKSVSPNNDWYENIMWRDILKQINEI
jgi:hypothetical protein